MIDQTNAQGRMVYRSYYSIMIDQTITTKGFYYSIIIIIFFLFFYCVGSIAATPIVAAIDQLLAVTFEVAANKYDLLFFYFFLWGRVNSGDPKSRRY